MWVDNRTMVGVIIHEVVSAIKDRKWGSDIEECIASLGVLQDARKKLYNILFYACLKYLHDMMLIESWCNEITILLHRIGHQKELSVYLDLIS